MDPRDRKNLTVLAAVILLIALCLFILHLMAGNLATERCIEEGRHNCLPIPGDNQ